MKLITFIDLMIKIPVRDIVVVDSFKVVLKDVFVGGIVVNIVVGFPKVELKYIFVGIVVVIIGVDSDNVECKDVLFGIIVVNVIVADVTTVDESSIERKCKSYHHCINKRLSIFTDFQINTFLIPSSVGGEE